MGAVLLLSTRPSQVDDHVAGTSACHRLTVMGLDDLEREIDACRHTG